MLHSLYNTLLQPAKYSTELERKNILAANKFIFAILCLSISFYGYLTSKFDTFRYTPTFFFAYTF